MAHFLVFFENLYYRLFLQRQQIHVIRVDRIRHDGGRVGINQANFDALLADGAGGLRTGIIELARLTDNDGAGANNKNRADVGILWHCGDGVVK